MFGSRKLIPLLVVIGMGAFGATAASAHGPGGHGHGGHGHGGHSHGGHGHWGHGYGHGHWGHRHHAFTPVYYGGECHIRRGYNVFGEFVSRRICY